MFKYSQLPPFIRQALLASALAFIFTASASAQTDIHITGAQAGFPVAVPQLCNAENADEYVVKISEVISRNLQLSGLFKVLNPATFVETPGKCVAVDKLAYSDWSVIGAEGLVKGNARLTGWPTKELKVELYLVDVLQHRTVVGKRYEASPDQYETIAHRFSNEVMRFFTGEAGIFGSRIAYISRVGRFKEMFLMDISGSNLRQLTSDKGLVLSPAWSPAGERIIYTSYVTRKPELYVMAPDEGGSQRLTHREGLELGAEYSPSGKNIIAAATFDGVSKIVLFDLRGKVLRKLTSGSAIDVSPSYSPDGARFAFCSNRAGGPQIYVQAVSGGPARRISYTGSNYCTSPVWSPKLNNIAFICRTSGNQIFVGPADGGQTVQLTFSGNNEDPSWSPDGRFLVFSSNFGRGGPKNIAVLSLLAGRPNQVSFAKSEDSQPTWSPVLH